MILHAWRGSEAHGNGEGRKVLWGVMLGWNDRVKGDDIEISRGWYQAQSTQQEAWNLLS